MDRIEEIRQRLAALEPLLIELEDESHRHAGHAGARSGGGHFELRIVATCFTGKPTLARHRLIYAALGELMQTRIHALSILAQTPEEAAQA
ncbi:BolA family transcriptional regulator [Uliginosibacterium sp. TH139]|uniref:BolA family protein n=1 Tax=Uliginosibacterium sp. TH139 TaxID=2067453 RepID=UPI000C7A2CE2|nr:BolA family protein [Uliginosibacterium sp. TH139]PLK47531.1 BolA family transcriptional regulator [Uliginosibacterium sp. TH139]